MNIISKRSTGKVLKGDGFQIAQQAQLARQAGYNPLDATLGTFYYDDGMFHGFETVKDILKASKDEDLFSYAPIAGGPAFAHAVLNWVFGNNQDDVKKEFNLKVTATPGGTGAISSTIYLTLDKGNTILIPDLSWGPYQGIANNYGVHIEKFSLFANNSFNLYDFQEKAEAIIKKQNKLVVIINDPCQNPSGYTMSKSELQAIISFLNEKSNIPCVLLYDIAYIDYSNDGRETEQNKLKVLLEANSNVLISLAFSASKSFCVYGQRLGAQILMSKDNNLIHQLYQAETYYARHSWSNSNRAMIKMIETIDQNDLLKNKLLQEIDEVTNQLSKRSKLFLEEAKEVGLIVFPYKSGFFISIPCDNNEKTLNELREKEHLFLLPFYKSVRIAICAVPYKDVSGLAGRIKKYI